MRQSANVLAASAAMLVVSWLLVGTAGGKTPTSGFVPKTQPSVTLADLRAFPGAEGFGAYTPGGRGGKVYTVTTLEDYADKGHPIKGSLRAAIEAKEPRIVVFAVSGTIHLKKRLRIDEPFITVAGQTAPGDGICVADEATSIGTHDVIVRHMRFRRGDVTANGGDCFWARNAQNVIVDHCSISWGLDENFSFTKSTTNVTAQWCIIAEALNPGHHGYGSLLAPDVTSQMSFHHNLYACNHGRTPRAGSRELSQFFFDYRNNVAYDWGCGWDWGAWGVCGTTEENLDINFIGNYSIAGPDTSVEKMRESFPNGNYRQTTEQYRQTALSTNKDTCRIYQAGNKIDSNVNGKLDGADTGWGMVLGVCTKMGTEFPIPAKFAVKTEPVDEAYKHVLEKAGAMPWHRDAADARIIEDVRKQTGKLIKSQEEVGSWPQLKGTPAPKDSDGDGIPDGWETAHGLNPSDVSDAVKPAKDAGGYTNIEVYINSLVK